MTARKPCSYIAGVNRGSPAQHRVDSGERQLKTALLKSNPDGTISVTSARQSNSVKAGYQSCEAADDTSYLDSVIHYIGRQILESIRAETSASHAA